VQPLVSKTRTWLDAVGERCSRWLALSLLFKLGCPHMSDAFWPRC